MRIKKKHIKENIEKAGELANDEIDAIGSIAKDIEGAVANVAGEEEAKEMAGKIAKTSIDMAYGDEEISEGDDAVSRGIEAGINPDVDKDLNNDFDGQMGGPDYGQEEDPSKPVKGDLPFESFNKQISEGIDFSIDELSLHIINLNNHIASTDDPKELAFLKKWKEETRAKLDAKLKAHKTNEGVRPKMSKDQLIETVLGKKERQVIKTFKVKDLRNE